MLTTKIKNPHVAHILRRHGWETARTEGEVCWLTAPIFYAAAAAVRAVMHDQEEVFYELRYGPGIWEAHWVFMADEDRAELARKIVEDRRRKAHAERLWRTSTGQVIPFEQMEDLHLMNAIECLRRIRPASPKLPRLIEEAHRRGFSTERN